MLNTHLICRVGHVGFDTLLWALSGVQFTELHVEQVEDEAVERWTQTVTQSSDSRDHPLHHT